MFTGREYDSETGNYYYRVRYYSPKIGRFLQTDPIRYAGGLNLYAYCGNNPLNWLDPLGLCRESIDYPSMGGLGKAWELTKAFGEGFGDGLDLTTFGENGQIPYDRDGLERRYGDMADFSEWCGVTSVVCGGAAGVIGAVGMAVGAGEGAVGGGIGPIRIGQAGEEAVGIYGPKTAIEINGRIRIPDQVTNEVLREVKNVQNISYTRQLRDYADFAQQEGLTFELYTRSSTQISGPLNEAINNDVIIHKYIPGR
jgi:RHS repeat-associated protein